MSLTITATLILAGLVAYSSAFAIQPLQDLSDIDYLPGFNYTREKNAHHEKLIMSAEFGKLLYPRTYDSQSEWSFKRRKRVATIRQITNFPSLVGMYWIDASAGDVSGEGVASANLGKVNFTLALSARGRPRRCRLNIKVKSPEGRIGFSLLGLDNVKEAFREPSVAKDLVSFVWKTMVDVLPSKLSTLVAKNLPRKLDINSLCKKILAATPDKFPHPKL